MWRGGNVLVLQDTVAATRRGLLVLFLRAFLVKVAASTPQAARGLPAIYPDMAEFLAFEALH
jgi:hypothetical protein